MKRGEEEGDEGGKMKQRGLQLTSKQNRVKGKTLYKERINQTVAKKDARPTTKNVTRLDPDLLVGSTSITPGLGTAFFSVRYVSFFSVLKKERSVM